MSWPSNQAVNRRAFLSAAAATGAAAGAFALFSHEAAAAPAPPVPAASSLRASASSIGQGALDVSQPVRVASPATFDAIKQIDAGDLSIGYAEAGPADGPVV